MSDTSNTRGMGIMSEGGFFERVGTEADRYREVAGEKSAPVPQSASGSVGISPDMQQLFRSGFKRFGSIDSTVFYGVAETHDALPAGLYRCEVRDMIGPVLVKQRIETDKLLELPDDAGMSIIDEFRTFWDVEPKFRERGFLHKRGFLLWGPPGSGKTSTLQLLIKRLIERQKGVVLLIERPEFAAACLALVRGIETTRPVIAVLEDIDALVQRHGEHQLLALLDGEAQVDSICFVATTNYPERLDRRFVDRPSRFDTIRYIGMPSAAARRMYFSTKEPSLPPAELDIWVEASEGFSIAHLKEMIIAVRCFGQPLDDVVARLAEMHERKPTSDQTPDTPSFGFGRTARGAGQPARNGVVRP